MQERSPQPPMDSSLSWVVPPLPIAPTEVSVTVPEPSVPIATLPPGEQPQAVDALPSEPQQTAFRLERRIAVGGMGEVWLAHQRALDRVVAVKRVRTDRMRNASDSRVQALVEEFRGEALAAAALEHPNIVPVYDAGVDERGVPLIAMKLVEGRSWSELLREDWSALGEEDFLSKHLPILVQMGQAVAFAHSRGIVHRDLKPSQLMIGAFGEALLMDWGLAIRGSDEPTAASGSAYRRRYLHSPSTASNPAGTPALMAPEQTLPTASQITPLTDVFLLGSCLYFLLTGTYPYDAPTCESSLALAHRGLPDPPMYRAPDRIIPEELAALAMEAMARNPADRVPSAGTFVQRLQDFIGGTARRRQAEEMLQRARKALATGERSYEALAGVLRDAEEAGRLWPANHAVSKVRSAATVALAKEALGRGDLSYAKLHAESLESGVERSTLLESVAEEQRRRARREVLLRVTASLVVLLCIAIAGASAAFTRTLNSRNRELAARTVEAEAARADSERRLNVAVDGYRKSAALVHFVVSDLKDVLDLRIPRDVAIARKMGDGVARMYRELDASEMDRGMRLGHAGQLLRLADAYLDLGLLDLGGELAVQAEELVAGEPGERSLEAQVHLVNARLATQAGAYAEAENHYLDALTLIGRLIGDTTELRSKCLMNLATLYRAQGRLREALPLVEEASGLVLESKGIVDPRSVSLTISHAALLSYLQRFDEADRILEVVAKVIPEAGLCGEQLEAYYFFTRAQVAKDRGLPPDAIVPPLRKALEIYDRTRGAEHTETVSIRNNLATILLNVGEIDEAERQFRWSLDFYLRVLGGDTGESAVAHNNLGRVHSERGHSQEAISEFRESVRRFEAIGSPENPDLGGPLVNLGRELVAIGEYEEGLEQLHRAAELRRSVFGAGSPIAQRTAFGVALAYLRWAEHLETQSPEEAAALRQTALAFAEESAPRLLAEGRAERLHYAELLWRAGERERAREVWSAATAVVEAPAYDEEGFRRLTQLAAEMGVEAPPAPPPPTAFTEPPPPPSLCATP